MQAHNIRFFQDLFNETNIIWFGQLFFFPNLAMGSSNSQNENATWESSNASF